ncbi:unnamed protein product [Rodentolepis nana]|uniref:CTNNB1 binding N-teminal domain-containing protein n=1 Tax=Rodentolepis nana TaxID=102285 RepID=A0A0R3TWB7_RODNA|nr:unnamed protein product [Rodentolepis nana]
MDSRFLLVLPQQSMPNIPTVIPPYSQGYPHSLIGS